MLEPISVGVEAGKRKKSHITDEKIHTVCVYMHVRPSSAAVDSTLYNEKDKKVNILMQFIRSA